MGASAPVSNQPARRSLSLLGIAVALACVAAVVWIGLRSGSAPLAHATRGSEAAKPMHNVLVAPQEQLPPLVDEPARPTEPTADTPAPVVSPAVSAAQLQARIDTAIAMAQNSFGNALRWSKSLPPAERVAAIVAAANEAARTKPEEALAALVEIEPSRERDAAITHAASQWATLDPKSATEWAAEGTPGELREQICSAVAISMANQDPRGAADFLAMQMAEGLPLRTAAVSVIQRWAQVDERSARQWAEQFPQGPLRDDALREVEAQARASASK